MEGERNERTKRESFVLLWCARLCYVCCDRRRQWPIRLWRCGVRSFESLVKCQSKRPAKPILTGNVWTSPGCYLLVTHLFFFFLAFPTSRWGEYNLLLPIVSALIGYVIFMPWPMRATAKTSSSKLPVPLIFPHSNDQIFDVTHQGQPAHDAIMRRGTVKDDACENRSIWRK